MKAVILAGGLGTRLSEETVKKPKPMVNIGGMPIIWHIMRSYVFYGINEFIICGGYKQNIIKEYFSNLKKYNDVYNSILEKDVIVVTLKNNIFCKIHIIDTGQDTMTGGRLKRVMSFLKNDENFCFTYGDGLSDIDIRELIKFHLSHGRNATITAVHPPGRFGALDIKKDNFVSSFKEKPEGDDSWINGGYFVLSRSIFEYINDDTTVWEEEPLENLAKQNQLLAYKHKGFWQPMDTMREKDLLEKMWINNPLWKKWK